MVFPFEFMYARIPLSTQYTYFPHLVLSVILYLCLLKLLGYVLTSSIQVIEG
jgi:hypothetical protein